MPLNTPGNTLLFVSIVLNIFAGTCGTFSDEGQWCSKRGAIASLAMAAVMQGALALYDRAYGVELDPARRTWSARVKTAGRVEVALSVVMGGSILLFGVMLRNAIKSDRSVIKFAYIPMMVFVIAFALGIPYYLATIHAAKRTTAAEHIQGSVSVCSARSEVSQTVEP